MNALRASISLLVIVGAGTTGCDKGTTGDEPAAAPRVVRTDPVGGATGIPVDVTVEVAFSEPMAASFGSVTLNTGEEVELSWAGGGTTLVIDPATDLRPGAHVEVTLGTDFVSAAGKSMPNPFRLTFATAAATACDTDQAPPELTSSTSVELQAGTRRAAVELTFDEPAGGLSATALDLTATAGAGLATIASVTPNHSNTAFTVFVVGLADGDAYDLAVAPTISDSCGNTPASPATVSLTVADACAGDTAAPILASPASVVLPAHTTSTVIDLLFDEVVYGLDGAALTLTPNSGGDGFVSSVAGDGSGLAYHVFIDRLANGEAYTLSLAPAVVDACGNSAAGTSVAISVTDPCTSDTTGPTLTSAAYTLLPAATQSYTLVITFNEPLVGADSTTVTASHTGGGAGAASVTNVHGAAETIYVDLAGLGWGDTYDITVSTAVTDACGNPIAAAATVAIEIEDPCAGNVSGPVLNATSAGGGRVELSAPVWPLVFDEEAINVDANLWLVKVAGVGTDLGVTVIQTGPTSFEAQLSASDWVPGDELELIVDTGVVDVCGLPLAPQAVIPLLAVDCVADFTPPTVQNPVLVMLPAGSTSYQLRFSEPVTPITLANLGWAQDAGTGTGTLAGLTRIDPRTYEVAFSGSLLDGDAYTLSVGGAAADLCFNSITPASITLNVVDAVPPASSEPVIDINAADIDPGPGATVTYTPATPDAVVDDTTASCGPGADADLAFFYAVQSDGNVTVDTFGSSFDTVLEAFNFDSSLALGCSDDALGLQSRVDVAGCYSAGDILHFTVDNYTGTWDTNETLVLSVLESGPALRLDPAPGAAGVPDTASIVLQFPTSVDPTAGSVTITGSGATGTVSITLPSPLVVFSDGNRTVTVSPGGFDRNETVAVTFAGQDTCGAALTESWSFTTWDIAILLYDSFEYGLTLDPSIWVSTVHYVSDTAGAHTGSNALFHTLNGATESATMDASSCTSIDWSYFGKFGPSPPESTDYLYLQWSIDGFNWYTVDTLNGTNGSASYVQRSGTILSPTAFSPDFRVRLSQSCSMASVDQFVTDDILLTCGSAGSTPASTTVLAPNGGQVWYPGELHDITWSSSGTPSGVDIYYSLNGGGTWIQIAANAPDSLSYTWTVPSVSSTSVLVRVEPTGGSGTGDQSNAPFTIRLPSATVSSPNGGEIWVQGESRDITWTTTGSPTAVDIYLSTDGGGTWSAIVAGLPDTGTYAWTVPTVSSSTCLVRVSATGGTADDSNGVFTIAAPSIRVTSPNGGEAWGQGWTRSITWVSGGTSGVVNISYSIDGGGNWVLEAASVADTGSYSWTLPFVDSPNCLVWVEDAAGGLDDISDGLFTITPSPALFADDFEDGDYAGWVSGGGSFTSTVTATTAADGSSMSLTMSGGSSTHGTGLSQSFASVAPSQIDFWVRSSSTSNADGYFVIGNSMNNGDIVVWFYMRESGTMALINDGSTTAHGVTPYLPNVWYHITLVLDWPAQTVDFYIDGMLAEADVAFRGFGLTSFDYLWLYNFSSGSQAWWDEILFSP